MTSSNHDLVPETKETEKRQQLMILNLLGQLRARQALQLVYLDYHQRVMMRLEELYQNKNHHLDQVVVKEEEEEVLVVLEPRLCHGIE